MEHLALLIARLLDFLPIDIKIAIYHDVFVINFNGFNTMDMTAKDLPPVRRVDSSYVRQEPKKEIVQLTVRLTKEQHQWLRKYAFNEESTIQSVILDGLYMLLKDKGYPRW